MANIFDDIFKNLRSKEQKNANPNINTIDSNLNSTGSVFSAPNQPTSSTPKANTSKVAADKPTQTKVSTSTKKENNMDFFTKYFTKEGTASLPNDSVWKKLDQGLSGNNANISMNSNNIGFGTSDVNPKNVSEGKKLYEKSILESNQKKLAEGTASPLLKTQNWLNTAIQGGDDIIGSQIKRANQEKLDEEFTPYVDTDAINEKIKLDKNYATKLIDNQGKLIDYGEKINQLKAQLDNTHNSFDKDQIQMQLDAIYSIQEDQKKLQYSSYYEYLKQQGATEDEINEFKNYVISQDDSGIKRVLEFVGGTVESWAGSFVKAVNGVYGAVAKLTGMDYDPNSENSTANAIIDNAEQLMINAQTNASGVERDIYEIYGGISPFVYDTILALATSGSSLAEMAADPAKAKQMADRALLLADISVFGSKIKEDMDEGYDFDASFVNSVAHAALNHFTESVIGKGTDRIVEFATNSFASKAAQKITENYVVYTAKYLAQSFGGEALEEGFEGLAEPIIDGITLKGGITLDQYLNQVLNGNIIHQMYVGGMGGLLMGTVNVGKATIQSKTDYENIKNWRKVLVDLYNSDESFNANDYMFIQDQINDCNDMLRDYTEKNPFINAFLTEGDKNIINMDVEEAHNLYKKAESVEIQKGLQPILEAKQQMLTKENELYAALDQKLKQENINMSAVDYENLSSEAKVNTSITAKVAQQLNKSVNFANLVDKNGDIVDGVVVNGQTIINPNAKLGALSTLMHEYTHGVENSKYYGKLKKVVKDFFGDGYDAAISKIKDDYSTITVLNDSDAEKELVAITTQSLLDQYSFVQDMVKYNNSLAFKLYQDIKNLGGIVGDKFQKIEYNFMRAFDDAQALATTGSEAVDFSYIKNADIMMAQKMYLQDQIASKNAKVDPKVLEVAQQDMTVMADLMSTNSNLLPTEVIGKVLLKDASYGLSVENSTKCPRTLAYDELTNYVSENVGRPLTAIESFLVSQKLYSIAVDPQCLYCYVALDRKSYNEFVGRYIDQRNDVIKAYRDAGSPKIRNYNNAETAASNDKLFRDFLDGRKPTINMWQRYKSWIDAYNSGEGLLTKKDVASDWSRSEIQKAGGSKAEQLKDALAYAQSASWAKKSYEYRAYFDDIRKLTDRKIKELNKHYGLRWYSFNDYTPAYILENMQQFTDAALRGLKGLAYTKDADFARIFAPTGVNINISVFARKNANGNYEIDPVQSANLQEAIELRNKYNNVGIVVTATDAEGVRWAMDQEWSDVVIPFHIVRTGADIAQYYKWSVFNAEQNDTVADKNVWKNYVESLNKPEKKVSKMIYPSEHQNNYELYKKLCEERGLKPRFASFEYNEDGTVNKNYMKLVNETRQSDLETTTLQPIFDQDAALESFERFKNKGGFYGGWYRDGVDLQTEANEVANDILEIEQGLKKYEDIKYGEGYVDFNEYLEMKKRKNKVAKMHGKGTVKASLGIKASDLTNYSTAVKDGDIDVAGKIVAKVAAEKGYNVEAWHGTLSYGFDQFKTDARFNGKNIGTHFGSQEAAEGFANAEEYGHGDGKSGVYHVYLKVNNPYETFDMFAQENSYIACETWNLADQLEQEGNNEQYELARRVKEYLNATYNIPMELEGDEQINDYSYEAYEYGENNLSPQKRVNGDGFYNLNNWDDDTLYEYLVEVCKENGYDSMMYENDLEDEGQFDYVVFDPEQIKSADPVTYDADGNMIPLEERFDLDQEDIRYSKGVSLENLITDINDERYYTYDNLIKMNPLEVKNYETSELSKIRSKDVRSEFEKSKNIAIGRGCTEFNDNSYAVINENSGNKIYVNEKIIDHAISNKNNKYVLSTIENLYPILEDAVLINQSFETDDSSKNYAIYYNYVNFDNPTLVRIVTSYGNVENVNAVAYAANTKKGSIADNTSEENAPFTVSLEDLLTEINRWDQTFRKDLPVDVQLRLNDIGVGKEEYTNKYSKGISLDSLGKELTPAQDNYFKDSKAKDDQGRLLTLYHGSPNATFTVFNDTEDPRYDQGKNPNNAIYLTTNLDVARGFSDSEKIIDPYKIYSTETVDDFNRVVKESGYDFELMQLEEIYPDSEKVKNYYLVGNGDDICSSMDQGDMEQYYDLWDALEDYDDEAETYKLNVGSTVEEALQSIKELMPVDKGNYQVYANATNPFVVDCDGSLWSEIKTPKEIATDKETMTTREIEDWVAQNGEYDSIIFKNIVDPAPYAINQEQESDIVVVFDSNQIKSTNNLNPTFDSDIRYSKGISLEEIEEDNKWSRETTDIIDDVNSKIGSDLTVEDIDDILHQRPINPKTIDAIENTKKVMIDEADKWIKGYATIKAEYPIFSKDTLNNALYEVLIYGDLTESTYNSMANTISSEFAYEGIDGDIRQEINDFINESLNTFNNEAKYKAGEIDKDQVRKAIVENNAYNQRDIQGSFDRMAEGSAMNRLSSDIKKDYQAEYQPIVDNLIKQDVVTRETKGRKIDSKVSDWKTMDQNIFELANGNPDLYKTLMDKIRYECLDSAADRKATMLKSAQDDVINKVRELGIKEGSKEDIAVQYVLEGHTEQFRDDIDLKSPEITQESIDEFKRNPYMPYTQEMLKNQYDYDMDNGKKAWENINTAADIIREAYEDAFSKVTMTQIAANGDVEGNADYETTQLLVELDNAFTTLESIKDEIRRNGSKESTQAAYEIAERKYNQLVKQYNARIDKDSKGDLTRRQLTPHRENYSHHIVKRNVISTFNSIRNAELLTPTELAGTSDYTNPNTAWSSFSAAQDGGKYTPTALGSYAAYIKEAADVVAYNPVILELRQFNKDIKATAQGTTLNRFSEYLNDYCNMLAGKRNNLDRGFQKLAGAKVMRTITALNSYAKQAALVGNFRSALVQFANIPNGLGILESNGGKSYVGDVGKGIVDWIKTFGNTDTTAIDQSSFMTNRYFDLDTGRSGVGEKIKDAADFLLSAGDKVGAEIIWWSAYEQGTRQGVDNAVQYADEITRSAIAGRTKEDMALAMQSQVVNLFLPFQVENNNLFQTLKQETSSRKGGALATYMVAAYLFNEIIKYITGGDDEVLPEFITPIVEEIKKVIDGEKTIDDAATNSFLGEIAEAISLTPAGQQIVGLMFGDDSDTVFGEYNPARYGNTNIGLSGVGKIVKDLKQNEVPSVALTKAAEDLVGGYVKGGKQITRTVGGLQSMGALPKLKQDGEIEISPINYSGSGKISYVNDQNNIADWIRAALFGKSNTSEAQKYYDSFKTLSDADARIFNALQSSDNNYYENFKEVKAFKEAKANDKANASLRDQLKEDGKYDDYIRSIQSSYQSYLNTFDYETNGESPKTYEQYAKQFGLTSDELKEDSYDNFYKAYNITDSKQKVISKMSKVENVKNALGKTIANSGATLRRIAYEEAGIYDQILEYIDANGLEYGDFGLSKTVVGYDQNDIAKMAAKIDGVKYEETAGSSNGSSGSSSSSDTKKAKKAMKAYLKAIKSGSTKNSSIKNNMTTVKDARSNAEKIISNSLKSVK